MQNIKEIKKHLEEISSNILITYDEYNIKDKSISPAGYTIYSTGMISVNTHNLKLINSGFPLDKRIKEKEKIEEAKDEVTIIISYLLHELYGYQKNSYKTNNLNLSSPTYFIENGEIYKITILNLNEKKVTKRF